MPRILHITINEADERRTRRGGGRGRGGGFDPEADETMPRVDDPGNDETMPPVDDPGSDRTMPGVDDPGAPYSVHYGYANAGPVHGCCCAGACDCKQTEVERRPGVTPRDYSGFVIVRTAAGVDSGSASSLWDLALANSLDGLKAVLEVALEEETGEPQQATSQTSRSAIEEGAYASFSFNAELSAWVEENRREPPPGPQLFALLLSWIESWLQDHPDRCPRRLQGWLTETFGDRPPAADKLFESLLGWIEKNRDCGEAAPEKPHHPEPTGVLVSRPLIELPEHAWPTAAALGLSPRQLLVEKLGDLETKAETSSFRPLHSLLAYWRLDLRPYPELAAEVVTRLNELAEVDLAYRELTATDPQTAQPATGQALTDDQGYLNDAPAGIGARWAWQRLPATGVGQRLRLYDLEQGWNPEHENLTGSPWGSTQPVYGTSCAGKAEGGSGHHGTAVLGQLAATASADGVEGAASRVADFVLTSHYRGKQEPDTVEPSETHPFAGTNGHVAAAAVNALLEVVAATNRLRAGDVLLVEVQRGRYPTEIDAADLDAIRLATALGAIVVEAAGNGGRDLDRYRDPDSGFTLRRGVAGFRDSGAILVGAARAALPHDRAGFSNYGSRLDCFAWGDSVTTCGYGDLRGGASPNTYYTNTFNGTSSAAPVIAGAAALVQALHRQHAGQELVPRAMRALLADPATGTRQGPKVAGAIGVMPDLCRLIRDRLQLVDDLYLRKRLGDGGGTPTRGDDVSSCPDVLVWKKLTAKDPDEAQNRFGDPFLRDRTPVPGWTLDPTKQNYLYVRLRNRGLVAGRRRVHLFASPAATLITPEWWEAVGSPVDSSEVPPGGLPSVQAPTAWTPGDRYQGRACSFLAVLAPMPSAAAPDEPPQPPTSPLLLPPGPPYFDWAEYRAFLRGTGVGWRNVHRVKRPASGDTATISFYVAGTPDLARHFRFEVLQRLPADAEVTLDVPASLAAKLIQAQPWLGEQSPEQPLLLPRSPRVDLGRVELAAGSRIEATLGVKPGALELEPGHSLAIRQLWRGEEVGRITWYFLGS